MAKQPALPYLKLEGEKRSIYAGRDLDFGHYFDSANHATNMALEVQISLTVCLK